MKEQALAYLKARYQADFSFDYCIYPYDGPFPDKSQGAEGVVVIGPGSEKNVSVRPDESSSWGFSDDYLGKKFESAYAKAVREYLGTVFPDVFVSAAFPDSFAEVSLTVGVPCPDSFSADTTFDDYREFIGSSGTTKVRLYIPDTGMGYESSFNEALAGLADFSASGSLELVLVDPEDYAGMGWVKAYATKAPTLNQDWG